MADSHQAEADITVLDRTRELARLRSKELARLRSKKYRAKKQADPESREKGRLRGVKYRAKQQADPETRGLERLRSKKYRAKRKANPESRELGRQKKKRRANVNVVGGRSNASIKNNGKFDELQYRELVLRNSATCPNCNCTTGTNLKHCWACRSLMCRTSCRSSRRVDANIDDDNYPVNNNNTRKQKERYHLDIVTLHSKFITREQLLKKFTETTIVQDCYSNLIQFIRGIDFCKDLFTIISPMNNKARFNWQSLQPTRMMFGETKNRNNNHTNTVSQATYAKQQMRNAVGEHTHNRRCFPFNPAIVKFIKHVLIPSIKMLYPSMPDMKFDYTHMELKMYNSKEVFCGKDQQPLVWEGSPKKEDIRTDNNNRCNYHNDMEFGLDGIQNSKDLTDCNTPIATINLFSTRQYQYTWWRWDTRDPEPEWEKIKFSEIKLTLDHCSLNVLHSFDETPFRDGDFYYKTKHEATFKEHNGSSTALIFRCVKSFEDYDPTTNLLVVSTEIGKTNRLVDKSKTKDVRIDKLRKCRPDVHVVQQQIQQNIKEIQNRNEYN